MKRLAKYLPLLAFPLCLLACLHRWPYMPVLIGAVWIAAGMRALFRGTLALGGRRRATRVYTGNAARIGGAVSLAFGIGWVWFGWP